MKHVSYACFMKLHETRKLRMLHETRKLRMLHETRKLRMLHETRKLCMLHETRQLRMLHDSYTGLSLYSSAPLSPPSRPFIETRFIAYDVVYGAYVWICCWIC